MPGPPRAPATSPRDGLTFVVEHSATLRGADLRRFRRTLSVTGAQREPSTATFPFTASTGGATSRPASIAARSAATRTLVCEILCMPRARHLTPELSGT